MAKDAPKQSWSEWAGGKYNSAYNSYVPWLEDKYLAWYGENKTSYMAKGKQRRPNCGTRLMSTAEDTMKQNPLTDDKNVAAIQGGVAEGVGGQLSSGGLLGGVGDASSKEGVNRAERGDLDPSKQKTWTESLSGGYFGGNKK